jgi:hemolysin III
MTTLKRYFYEPVNTLTHLLGALASLVGLVILLSLTSTEVPKMLTLLIYGLSLVTLYTASTLFHGIKVKPRQRYWLNRLDHMAIFLFIAGTYTPIAYNLFEGWWRWGTLTAVWAAATVGMSYKLLCRRIHGFFNAIIYILLSWGVALPVILFTNIRHIVPDWGIWLIALGGLIYSVGFIVYYTERPNPWPKVVGHHEIWHLFVLAGSLCHFLFMLLVVVPFDRSLT